MAYAWRLMRLSGAAARLSEYADLKVKRAMLLKESFRVCTHCLARCA